MLCTEPGAGEKVPSYRAIILEEKQECKQNFNILQVL